MASTALVFNVNGGAASGGIGSLVPLPDLGGSLYAGYIFGSLANGSPGRDLSGNGRDCTFPAGQPGLKYLPGGPGFYGLCPFTDSDLVSAHSTASVVIVAKASPGDSCALAGTFLNTATQYYALLARDDVAIRVAMKGATTPRDIATTATRGQKFDVYAGVWTPSAIWAYLRLGAAGTSQFPTRAVSPSVPSMGGGAAMQIGNVPSNTFTGQGRLAIALFYNAALDKSTLDNIIYPALQANMALLGETI